MMLWVRAVRHDDNSVGLLDFDVVTKLGQTSFGKSVLVQWKPGASDIGASTATRQRYFTMKIVNKSARALIGPPEANPIGAAERRLNHERRILTKAIHPFLVQMHYAFQTAEKLYMVMDFVPGGDLFFHLKRFSRFPEPLVKIWVAELVLAIEYLHKLSIVYRELRPESGAFILR